MAEAVEDKFAGALVILAKSPEFAIFKTIILAQIEARRKKLTNPISSEQQIAEHNMLIGEITGMETVIRWPDAVLKNLETKEETDRLMQEAKERDNGR